ncbi:hypothetical protein BpHYR1_004679 [Brachionus plicatilis]|uniref:Uncharacterized protein n=1 Tax=Brachionus plicatilis TaxID=10195 RepID=A0A3M7R2U0_BRAPC|nr:hypothetical protein BpHYR1_004679 [Brachionus plicatilis]
MELEVDKHKTSFYECLLKLTKNSERNVYSRTKIDEIIKLLLQNKTNPNTKNDEYYYHERRHQVLEIAGKQRLIRKLDDKKKDILIIVATEDLFDEINTCHRDEGHEEQLQQVLNEKINPIVDSTVVVDPIVVDPVEVELVEPVDVKKEVEKEKLCQTRLMSRLSKNHQRKWLILKIMRIISRKSRQVLIETCEVLLKKWHVKINECHMTYQLGTKFGLNKGMVLKKYVSYLKAEINLSKEKTLREINALHSITGGQGFLKCNCSGKGSPDHLHDRASYLNFCPFYYASPVRITIAILQGLFSKKWRQKIKREDWSKGLIVRLSKKFIYIFNSRKTSVKFI